MIFKTKDIENQFYRLPLVLQEMAHEFEWLSITLGVDWVTVTRVADPVAGESGVHPAYRAIDFRDEHLSKRLYSKDQVEIILSYFNLKYARTDKKKCLIWHSFNSNPYHFHMQIPSQFNVFAHYNKIVAARVSKFTE